MKGEGKSRWFIGLPQALGIVGYIMLVGLFFSQAQSIFGKIDNNFLAPVLMLSLLSFSIMICGILMFAKPYKLFVEGKGTEAMTQVVLTTKWLAVLLGVVFVVMFLVR